MSDTQRRVLLYLREHPELHLEVDGNDAPRWIYNDVQVVPNTHRDGPAVSLRLFQSLYSEAWIWQTATAGPFQYALSGKGRRALDAAP